MSSYKIKETMFGSYKEYMIFNKETREKVQIVSDFGCNIRELVLKSGIHIHRVIDGHQVPARLKRKYSTCSFLSPFTGRIPKGQYTFKSMDYRLPINKPVEDNAIHGLIYNQRFLLKDKKISENHASLTFEHEIIPGQHQGYPFHLKIQKIMTLYKGGLSIRTKVTNKGKNDAPFADGWHPYLMLKIPIDNLNIKLPAKEYYTNDKHKIIDEKKKIKDTMYDIRKPTSLKDKNFDTCFTGLTYKNNFAQTILKDDEKKLILWQDKNYPFIQLYTPDHRRSIAIEPLSAPSNSFNNGIGLLTLKSGKKFQGDIGIELL